MIPSVKVVIWICIGLGLWIEFFGCTSLIGFEVYRSWSEWLFHTDKPPIFASAIYGIAIPVVVAAFLALWTLPSVILRTKKKNEIIRASSSDTDAINRDNNNKKKKVKESTMHPTAFRLVLPFVLVYGLLMVAGSMFFPLQFLISIVANLLGYVSILCFGLLFLPLQLDPILGLFGLSAPAALPIHIWLGGVAVGSAGIHSVLYLIKLAMEHELWTLVDFHFCERHGNDPDIFESLCRLREEEEGEHEENCACKMWRYYETGIVSIVAFLSLSLIALLRRRKHNLFYYMHIAGTAVAVIFVVMHFAPAVFFLMGGLLVYAGTHIPSYVERIFHAQRAPVMDAVVLKGQSEDCVAITLAATEDAMTSWVPGCYVQLRLARLRLGHPFSILALPKSNQLLLLVRVKKGFTKNLVTSIANSDSPSLLSSTDVESIECGELNPILMDGYYGHTDLFNEILSHDGIALVAGGVGIVPILSFLVGLEERLKDNTSHVFATMDDDNDESKKKKVISCYWACRDQSLIDYVRYEILPKVGNSYRIRFLVYKTGPKEAFARTSIDESTPLASRRVSRVSLPEDMFPHSAAYFAKGTGNDGGDHPPPSLSSPWAPTAGLVVVGGTWTNPLWLRLGTFGIISMCGMWLVWKTSLVDRPVYGVIGLLVVALLLSVLQFWFLKMRRRHQNPAVMDKPSIHKSGGLYYTTDSSSSSSLETSNHSSVGTNDTDLWEQVSGRPDLGAVVDQLATDHSNPAVFVCGPEGMVSYLRSACNNSNNNSEIGGRVPVALHEEAFEL